MSYILDALRKSEEARRRQQGPDLSLAEPTSHPERGRSSRALPLLALALLVNGAVLGIWLLRADTPPQGHEMVETGDRPQSQTGTQTGISSGTRTETGVSSAPVAPSAPADATRQLLPAPLPTPRTEAGGAGNDWRQQPVRRLDDLTPASRSRFPRLAISTHIYADDPGFREVSINGRRYQAGDSVAGAALLEITETGVLMGFEDQVIRLDLQDEWEL